MTHVARAVCEAVCEGSQQVKFKNKARFFLTTNSVFSLYFLQLGKSNERKRMRHMDTNWYSIEQTKTIMAIMITTIHNNTMWGPGIFSDSWVFDILIQAFGRCHKMNGFFSSWLEMWPNFGEYHPTWTRHNQTHSEGHLSSHWHKLTHDQCTICDANGTIGTLQAANPKAWCLEWAKGRANGYLQQVKVL